MSDLVTVELKVKPRMADEEISGVPQATFGTASVYELRADGTLLVVASLGIDARTVEVAATNVADAIQAAIQKLEPRQQALYFESTETDLGGGRFRVTFRIYNERFLVRTPRAVKEIY
jgi:hypothetical protein